MENDRINYRHSIFQLLLKSCSIIINFPTQVLLHPELLYITNRLSRLSSSKLQFLVICNLHNNCALPNHKQLFQTMIRDNFRCRSNSSGFPFRTHFKPTLPLQRPFTEFRIESKRCESEQQQQNIKSP